MGILRETFRVVQDVTSLGGTFRLRRWTEKHQRLLQIHHRLSEQIGEFNAELVGTVARVETMARFSVRRLKAAKRILDPLDQLSDHPDIEDGKASRGALIRTSAGSLTANSLIGRDLVPTLMGVAAGIATSGASWGTIQILGHASTGTAMAVLHGAAASNAGWAWLGGGSLAAGGGGMAAGHFVLPGIGTAVAVGVSSVVAHRTANRIAEQCEEIDAANEANELALMKLRDDVSAAAKMAEKLSTENRILEDVLSETKKKLFRFGFLSRWWRFLRFLCGGSFYASDELPVIERLQEAAGRFISAFR